MADFTPNTLDESSLNDGKGQYTKYNGLKSSDLNKLVEAIMYLRDNGVDLDTLLNQLKNSSLEVRQLNVSDKVLSNITPYIDKSKSLGSTSKAWKNVYSYNYIFQYTKDNVISQVGKLYSNNSGNIVFDITNGFSMIAGDIEFTSNDSFEINSVGDANWKMNSWDVNINTGIEYNAPYFNYQGEASGFKLQNPNVQMWADGTINLMPSVKKYSGTPTNYDRVKIGGSEIVETDETAAQDVIFSYKPANSSDEVVPFAITKEGYIYYQGKKLDTTLDEINTLLGNKLDKITTTTVNGQAYTKNIYGGQSMIDLTNNAIGNTIVWRDGNGRAKVAAPVDSLDIANKSYVDTNIASLDTRLTDLEGTVFYPIESEDTFISRTTAEGTNVVNGSTMEIESIEGASEVSENLIIIEDKDATTVNGVTYSIRDGVITLNGTASATSHTSITNATIKMNNATTYHYTMFNSNNGFSSNGVACYIQLYDGSSYKNYGNESTGTSLTTPDEINSKVLILSIASGTTFSNTKLKPMLVKGSTAPTEFSQGYSGIKHAYIGDFVSVDKNGETQTSLTLNQELPKGYVLTKEGLTKKWGSVTYSEDFENELIASGTNYIVDNEKTTIEYELATPTTDTTIKLPTTNTIKSYHNGTEYFTDTELPLTLNAIYRATNIEQEE